MTYTEIINLAEKMGITGLDETALLEYESKSDGLSGGVSKLYALLDRLISCHKAGVVHDFLYDRGGTKRDRLMADRLFCYSAALSGSFIPGWLEDRFKKSTCSLFWLVPFARLNWRVFRAGVMYVAVRLFGGSEKHWSGE